MDDEVRIIWFERDEIVRGLNCIDLNKRQGYEEPDAGLFFAVYILPEKREIYGWLFPFIDCKPVWGTITYVPAEKDLDYEVILLKEPETRASDFLKIDWKTWDFDFTEEEDV